MEEKTKLTSFEQTIVRQKAPFNTLPEIGKLLNIPTDIWSKILSSDPTIEEGYNDRIKLLVDQLEENLVFKAESGTDTMAMIFVFEQLSKKLITDGKDSKKEVSSEKNPAASKATPNPTNPSKPKVDKEGVSTPNTNQTKKPQKPSNTNTVVTPGQEVTKAPSDEKLNEGVINDKS